MILYVLRAIRPSSLALTRGRSGRSIQNLDPLRISRPACAEVLPERVVIKLPLLSTDSRPAMHRPADLNAQRAGAQYSKMIDSLAVVVRSGRHRSHRLGSTPTGPFLKSGPICW
jgi:hypothetical protein